MNVKVREGIGTGAIIQRNETTDGKLEMVAKSREFHADFGLNHPLTHA
jgi:hypothetical protein